VTANDADFLPDGENLTAEQLDNASIEMLQNYTAECEFALRNPIETLLAGCCARVIGGNMTITPLKSATAPFDPKIRFESPIGRHASSPIVTAGGPQKAGGFRCGAEYFRGSVKSAAQHLWVSGIPAYGYRVHLQ